MYSLASTLYPQLAQLVEAAGLPQIKEDDPEARLGKVEVSKLATQLRTTLATLKSQVEQLPAGNLSFDDQQWLLERLEDELRLKKTEVDALVKLVPAAGNVEKEAMDAD